MISLQIEKLFENTNSITQKPIGTVNFKETLLYINVQDIC